MKLNSWIWGGLDIFVSRGISFIALILFARILGPEQFGVIGIVSIFIALGNTLLNSGLTLSLIRSKEIDNYDKSTVFIFNLFLSVIITIIVFYSSKFVAIFFASENVEIILKFYSVSFFLSALNSVQLAILAKDLNFKKVALINLPSTLLAFAISLYLILSGFGVLSVVLFYLVTQVLSNLLTWFSSSWYPNSSFFSFSILKRHFGFGIRNMFTNIINVSFQYINNLLIGRFYSIELVSYYDRANSISIYPVSLIYTLVEKVSLPSLSKIQNEIDRMKEYYSKLFEICIFVSSPLMIFLILVSNEIFNVTLGSEWSQAIQYFELLCISGIIYPLHAINLNMLNAIGRSDLVLRLEIVKKVIFLIILFMVFRFGLLGLVIGNVFYSYIVFFMNSIYSGIYFKFYSIQQIRITLPSIIISSITYFICHLLFSGFSFPNDIISLFIKFTTFLLIYLSLSLGFNRKVIFFLKDLLR